MLVILTWVSVIGAQFRLEKEIIPRAVREGVHFNAIVVNEFGDIYLLESKFSEIYRCDRNGNILNRNGGFGWDIGQFDQPSDLCISGLDIVVVDQNNHRLVRYDRRLNYITTQDLRSESHSLIYPLSLATMQLNEIYVLCGETAEIMRLYIEKNEQTWFGGIEYGAYALNRPVSLRLNQKGILTVLQQDGSLVQYDRYGTPSGLIPAPPHKDDEVKASGLATIQNDWLVLIDNGASLQMFSAKTNIWCQPVLIGYDQSTSYVAATYINNRLFLLTKDGKIVVFLREQSDSKP